MIEKGEHEAKAQKRVGGTSPSKGADHALKLLVIRKTEPESVEQRG